MDEGVVVLVLAGLAVLRLAGACAFAVGFTVSVLVLVAVDLTALLFVAVVDCVVFVAVFVVAEDAGDLTLAVAATVLWPAMIAAFMQPWKKDLYPYLYLGLGPVALIWLVYWVFTGFKKK